MNTKRFVLDIKAVDGAPGSVDLYASVFGNIDRQGEIVQAGAFANLSDFVASGWLGLNHRWESLPVASIDEATQDTKGLRLRATWHTTAEAQETRKVVQERLARGKVVSCSIGYRVLKDRMDIVGDRSVRVLESIELYEASIVNTPANAEATVLGAKGPARISEIDAIIDEVKAGRVLSRENHQALSACYDRMKDSCDRLRSILDTHDPDRHVEMDEDTDVLDAPKRGGNAAKNLGASVVAECLLSAAKRRESLMRT